MESVSIVLNRVLLVLIIAAAGTLAWLKFTGDWSAFQNCPNTDVLSWDANLRFIYTLDARDDASSGHAARAIVASLRSPTWPPLHGWLASVLYIVSAPSAVTEASIGFGFYLLLCVAVLTGGIWLAAREKLPLWLGAAGGLFTFLCLFHSKELTAYSLSAMLETQGMFFYLLTLLALYRIAEGSRSPALLLPASLGLFLTKFPYGHILIMAVAPAALWQERHSVPRLFEFLRTSYRAKAAILPAVLVLITLFLALVRFLPGSAPNVKLFKYAFYLVVCLIVIDFNIKLYRARETLVWVPALWRSVYLYVCVPILALTLLEPDRFSSTVGTQLHQQDSSRSFLLSIFRDFVDHPLPLMALFCALAALAVWTILRKRSFTPSPLVFGLLVTVIHILILELLTSNKQVRHIYHLMPALILFSFLALVVLAGAIPRGVSAAILLLSTGVFFTGPGSLMAGTHRSSRYTCWTGPDRMMFAPVREAVALVPVLPTPGKTLLVNDFHEAGAPMPGAVWATDIDLLLRFRMSFKVRNDSRHVWKDWNEFDRVLHIAATCDETSPNALEARAKEMQAYLVKIGAYRSQASAPICITDYQISRNAETQ